jgi:hypothetical protein
MALVFNPADGTYTDPATGQRYAAQTSAVPAAGTPTSLPGQEQRNLGVSNSLLSQLGTYGQQYNQAQAGQTQLGSYIDKTINGSAPSVAGAQLTQGLGQIQSGVQSAASGATGANQPLAQYGAVQAYGDAAAKANQAAAVQRQQEVSDAERVKAGVLGQQASEAGNMSGQAISGANQASSIASGAAQIQAQIDQQNRMAWLNFVSNLAGSAGAAGVKLATSPSAAPVAAA